MTTNTPTTIKALTIWQPWASLVANGHKHYETRGWATPYRGPLAIHAAKRRDGITLAFHKQPEVLQVFGAYSEHDSVYLDPDRVAACRLHRTLPVGCVLGIADLTGVYHTEAISDDLSEQELAFGNYWPGRFAWKLENVRLLPEPIPARGYQSLWDWDVPESILHVLEVTHA